MVRHALHSRTCSRSVSGSFRLSSSSIADMSTLWIGVEKVRERFDSKCGMSRYGLAKPFGTGSLRWPGVTWALATSVATRIYTADNAVFNILIFQIDITYFITLLYIYNILILSMFI